MSLLCRPLLVVLLGSLLVAVAPTSPASAAATTKCRTFQEARFCAKFIVDGDRQVRTRVWVGDINGKRNVDVRLTDVSLQEVDCSGGMSSNYQERNDGDGWFLDYDPVTFPKRWDDSNTYLLLNGLGEYRFDGRVTSERIEMRWSKDRC